MLRPTCAVIPRLLTTTTTRLPTPSYAVSAVTRTLATTGLDFESFRSNSGSAPPSSPSSPPSRSPSTSPTGDSLFRLPSRSSPQNRQSGGGGEGGKRGKGGGGGGGSGGVGGRPNNRRNNHHNSRDKPTSRKWYEEDPRDSQPDPDELITRPINWNAPFRFHLEYIEAYQDAVAAKDLDAVMELFMSRRYASETAPSTKRDGVTDRLPSLSMETLLADDAARESPRAGVEKVMTDAAVTAAAHGVDPRDPDFLEYNMVLDACASAGDTGAMGVVLQDMMQRSMMLDADVYSLMMKAAAVTGDRPLAESTFQFMKDAEIPATPTAYAALIHLFMEEREYTKAYALFNKMKRAKVQPTDAMYYSMFDVLFKDGQAEHASYVWTNMAGHLLFKPSSDLISLIVQGFADTKNLEDLRSVLAGVRNRRWGFKAVPSVSALMSAFDLYAEVGDYKQATKMLKLFRRRKGLGDEVDWAELERRVSRFPGAKPGDFMRSQDDDDEGGGGGGGPGVASDEFDDAHWDRKA